MERVVVREGAWPRKSTSCHYMPVAFYAAWLPRSFTLNALGDITPASPPDICAFGDYLSSSSEKPIQPPVDWGATGFFIISFTFAVRA